MQQHDEGFTLVELLIVIVILGILAAVVVFAVGGITGESEAQACLAEKRAVQVAVESYKVLNDIYPATLGDIVGTVAVSSEGYLRSTPTFWAIGANGAVIPATTLPAGCV